MSLMRANMRPGGCATSAVRLTCRMPGIVARSPGRSNASSQVAKAALFPTGDRCRKNRLEIFSNRLESPPLMAKPTKDTEKLIAENRKAHFEYFIEERFEAGLVLQGWEV